MSQNLNAGYGQAVASALYAVQASGGKVFVVAKSAAAGAQILQDLFITDGDGKGRFYADIDSAINQTTANRGDVILVASGHTETLASAGAIALDVAGVSVIGIGVGADRPTLTFSATDSTFTVSAASAKVLNMIAVPSIDSVVSPFVVSAADCELDVEVQDASSTVECVRAVLTTAGADRMKLNLRYQGFTAGNACVNAIRLVGGTGARINVDFYGIASTAVVEFHTTATIDTKITGTFYVSGTTDLSKDVVDTVTGSTWSVDGFDSAAGAPFSGGSGNAVAIGDLSVIAANVVTLLAEFSGAAGIAAFPAAAAPANAVSMAEVMRSVYDRQLGDGTDASTNSILGKRVLKASDTLPATTTDALFTVSSGRVLITKLVGEVTTVVQAQACNAKINNNPTVGSTVIVGTNVDINALEAGATLTVEGDGTALVLGNGGTSLNALGGTSMEVAEGSIELETSATNTGATKWELWYIPLDDGATVAAA